MGIKKSVQHHNWMVYIGLRYRIVALQNECFEEFLLKDKKRQVTSRKWKRKQMWTYKIVKYSLYIWYLFHPYKLMMALTVFQTWYARRINSQTAINKPGADPMQVWCQSQFTWSPHMAVSAHCVSVSRLACHVTRVLPKYAWIITFQYAPHCVKVGETLHSLHAWYWGRIKQFCDTLLVNVNLGCMSLWYKKGHCLGEFG